MDTRTWPADDAGMNTQALLTVGAVFLAAGLVKGISGMGLPTLSMALLGLAMPPGAAAALMVLPSLITNVAQCLGPHGAMLLRRLWTMWLTLVLGVLLCPLPSLGNPDGGHAHIVMGLVLIVYGAWGLMKPTLPRLDRHPLSVGAAAGLVSGLLTATTGVFVMPMVPYLQALRLGKAELLQAMGISFTLATLALAARLGRAGFSAEQLPASALALAAALAGMWAGGRLLGRLKPIVFQRILYGVFLGLGLLMSWPASSA